MTERSYLSIGDVLGLLRNEFPDITISKIRFLESRGLLVPERTPSGYRKFYDHDVDRLRWILRQQREHFLPLKVIKGRLEGADSSEVPALFDLDRGEPPPAAEHAAVADPDCQGAPAELVREPVLASQRVNGSREHEAVGERTPAMSTAHGPRASIAPPNGAATALPAAPGALASSVLPAASSAPVAAELRSTVHADIGSGEGGERPQVRAAEAGATGQPSNGGADGGADGGAKGGAEGAEGGAAGTAGAGTPAAPGSHSGPLTGAAGTASTPPGGAAGAAPAPVAATAAAPARPVRRAPAGASGQAPSAGPHAPVEAGQPTIAGAGLTVAELAHASGLEVGEVEQLESFGLIEGHTVAGVRCFDEGALVVAGLAAGFAAFGVEARHLRLFKHAAERQIGLYSQVVLPLLRQRNPDARRRALDELARLSELGSSLQGCFARALLRELTGE